MPFKSDAQRRFMYSQHPEIAKRWRKEAGPQTDLPARASKGILAAYKRGEKKKRSKRR